MEATEVQAINDFILFSIAGGGSLASGFIYAGLGWLALIYVVSALVRLYFIDSIASRLFEIHFPSFEHTHKINVYHFMKK